MAPASTIMVVPSGRINNALLPRLVAIWWISSMPGFHAGRLSKRVPQRGEALREGFQTRQERANSVESGDVEACRFSMTQFSVLSYISPYRRACGYLEGCPPDFRLKPRVQSLRSACQTLQVRLEPDGSPLFPWNPLVAC